MIHTHTHTHTDMQVNVGGPEMSYSVHVIPHNSQLCAFSKGLGVAIGIANDEANTRLTSTSAGISFGFVCGS